MTIKVGVSAQPAGPIDLITGQASGYEADGFDSVLYPDHLMGWFPRSVWTPENSSIASVFPSPHLYLDPIPIISAVGLATKTLTVGTGVTDPIRRPPAEIARTFATLSQITGGRALLGIGAGELENTAPYGLDYSKQVSKLEEALHIIRLLWSSKDTVSFDGRFWKLDRAVFDFDFPDGVHPPIWVGAHGPRMLEITGQYGDGWYPSYPMTPAEYKDKLDQIRKSADASGRDGGSITGAYQLYVVLAPDHETSHQILTSPLAKAMSLVAPAWQWEHGGVPHPFGPRFEGLRDYVPEWLSKDELESAMSKFDIKVVHDHVVHGTPEEVIGQIEPFVDAGLQHLVLANLAPIAGLEFLLFAAQALRQVAAAFK